MRKLPSASLCPTKKTWPALGPAAGHKICKREPLVPTPIETDAGLACSLEAEAADSTFSVVEAVDSIFAPVELAESAAADSPEQQPACCSAGWACYSSSQE